MTEPSYGPPLPPPSNLKPQKRSIEHVLTHFDISEIVVRGRSREDLGNLKPLSYDIIQRGIISPVCVELRDGKPYLLAGERRICATRLAIESLGEDEERKADLRKIPAKAYQGPLSDADRFLIELHENLLRKDMTPREQALLTDRIHREAQLIFGKSTDGQGKAGHGLAETAQIMGTSKTTVSRQLEVAKFIKENPDLEHLVDKAKSTSDIHRLKDERERQLAMEELNRRAALKAKDKSATEETKLKTNLCNRFILGDFFELSFKLEPRSFDFIELDPDWGISFKESEQKESLTSAMKIEAYDTIEPKEYEDRLQHTLHICYDLMKDHSWMIVWYSLEKWHDITRRMLEHTGFKVCPDPAFWLHLQGGTATPAYRLGKCLETFFYCRKGTPRIQQMGRDQIYQFRTLRKEERSWSAEKPIELYEAIYKTFCLPSISVLVPFAGSGAALLAANNLQMQTVGYDTSAEAKEKFDFKVWQGDGKVYRSYKSGG